MTPVTRATPLLLPALLSLSLLLGACAQSNKANTPKDKLQANARLEKLNARLASATLAQTQIQEMQKSGSTFNFVEVAILLCAPKKIATEHAASALQGSSKGPPGCLDGAAACLGKRQQAMSELKQAKAEMLECPAETREKVKSLESALASALGQVTQIRGLIDALKTGAV